MNAEICSSTGDTPFPFIFYDTMGNTVNGTLISAPTSTSTSTMNSTVCIFPTANCGDVPTNNCCSLNYNSPNDDFRVGNYYMFIAFSFMMVPLFYSYHLMGQSMTPEEIEREQQDLDGRKPKFIVNNRYLPSWLKGIFMFWYELGLPVYITAIVVFPIFLKLSEQANMTVIERTTLSASEAFMVPYYTVFTFVEDIIAVRVSYALSQQDKVLTNQLIHAGIAGVIVTGVISGLIGTVLGIIPTTLNALTFPGLANDRRLYPGCAIIDEIDESIVFPYWMMESWGLMGRQIGSVMIGFFYGAHEYNIMGWLASIPIAVFAGIWFGNIQTTTNPLTLLGIGEIVMDYLIPSLLIGFIVSPMGSQIRERTGLNLSVKKVFSYLLRPLASIGGGGDNNNIHNEDVNNNRDNDNNENGDETASLLKEGLKIMFMDVIIQACMSCSVYLALKTDSAVAYKITALQSELPSYGTTYALGMAITAKVLGPFLLSNNMHGIFVKYIGCLMVCVLFLVILIVGTTVPFFEGLAFASGKNACAYASSEQCVNYFTNVFGVNATGGDFTLFFTYYVFPIAASMDAVLLVLRSVLLTCLDFDFMLYATFAAGLSYIPAICIARFLPTSFQNQAIAFFSAYYVPQFVLTCAFSVRLLIIARKLSTGEHGPWSKEQQAGKGRLASIVARDGGVSESSA